MKKSVFFIASYGDFNKLPLGGGQTAARRLLQTIRNIGYITTPIHRHPPTAQNKKVRAIQFVIWTIVDPFLFFFSLVFRSRKDTLTIYMGYMGDILVPLEYMASQITHALGFTNVFYLAGGGTEKRYHKAKKWQKYLMQKTLNNYKLVMTEGYENMDFVKSISTTETFYLPNFTENGFAPSACPIKPTDRWNIFYFGRINETKNIPLCIDAFNLLCKKYENVYLTIVGGGTDAYCKLIENIISDSPYSNRIKRIGRSSHDELKRLMSDQHIMLFPSNEPREGHSNALNEAMSFGLVPIVSSNNFLPSIVGDLNLVVQDFSPVRYFDKLDELISCGMYQSLSEKMYKRVQDNFVQNVVEENLKNKLSSL